MSLIRSLEVKIKLKVPGVLWFAIIHSLIHRL